MGDGMRNLSQAVKRVLEEGSYEGRFLLTPATGAPFPVYFRGTVYQQEHRQAGTILVFRDLTAQEALELRVEESERLAALAQIASGMAHEIRNPLMAVGGLIRRCDRCLPEEHTAKAYLPAVLENVRRMEAMVKEIEEYVSYVRVAEDKQGLIDLKAVLHLALARLEGSTDLQNVRLKVESLGGLLVQGDELSLVEMFYQLFANAVEAMPQGGRLHLQVDQKDGQALVRITDSGKGIAPEHLSNLSHPFFTTKMTGAGMGLTKVYMIAGRHRGQIRVDSQTGQGTTFKVTLPLAVAGSQ
jgi:two-component system sporulation sensor kinase A